MQSTDIQGEAPHGDVLSVSALNSHVKHILERDQRVQAVTVIGEIVGYHLHRASGHAYFTLKDEECRVDSVMFKSDLRRLTLKPEDGMEVLAFGGVSLYQRSGRYQLYVRALREVGGGRFYRLFEQTRKSLERMGLLDEARKRPLPSFPSRVVLFTSPEGAAVTDIVSVAGRRSPMVELVIVPCVVQGADAASSICSALRRGASFPADAGILARGGGSTDDLFVFNEASIAQGIAAMPYPMISAIGHERDFTIADLVADVRAPTPSAAAELLLPDWRSIEGSLEADLASTARGLRQRLRELRAEVSALASSAALSRPDLILRERRQLVDDLSSRATTDMDRLYRDRRNQVTNLIGRLESLNPLRLLDRGYSVVKLDRDDTTVRSIRGVEVGDLLSIRVADGQLSAVVQERSGGDSDDGGRS